MGLMYFSGGAASLGMRKGGIWLSFSIANLKHSKILIALLEKKKIICNLSLLKNK